MNDRHKLSLPSHDFLSALARDDPQGYELLRGELIKNLIDSAPVNIQPRLRGIQFRIDCERQLSRSTLGMAVKLYGLMWGSFLRLNDSMQDFVNPESKYISTRGSIEPAPSLPNQCARILELQPRPKG